MPVGAVIGLMLLTFAIGWIGGMIWQLGLQIGETQKQRDGPPAVYYTVGGEIVSKAYAKSVWDDKLGTYVMPTIYKP